MRRRRPELRRISKARRRPFGTLVYWRARWRHARQQRRCDEEEVTLDEVAIHACDYSRLLVEQHPRLLAVSHLQSDCLLLSKEHPETNFLLPWKQAKDLLAAGANDRPALLTYVAEVLESFLERMTDGGDSSVRRDKCAAEFWTQRRRAGQSINWHWDKDEALRDSCGAIIHPAVSTVTYLTEGGAPTVLLEVRAGR